MGIVGKDGNIRQVFLCNIRYTRKPSANLPLKGLRFDTALSDVTAAVLQDCGLMIAGAKETEVHNVDTGIWRIVQSAVPDGCTE